MNGHFSAPKRLAPRGEWGKEGVMLDGISFRTLSAAAIVGWMGRWSLRLVTLGLLVLTLSDAAVAAPMSCGRRTDVLEQFANKFKEFPTAIGLTSGGNLVEVLSTGDGSTWSIIITTPNGVSCLIAAGESWQELKEAAADGSQV